MKKRNMSPSSLRNLPQYKGMTDTEISELLDVTEFEGIEEDVAGKIRELEKDYDTSEMKYNDRVLLEQMATLMVRLEYGQAVLEERVREGQIDSNNALREEQRLKTMLDGIRGIQNDLGITRSKRTEDAEDNPVVLFDNIRKRAKRFIEDRLCWFTCECGMLLGSVHFTHPDLKTSVTATCERCGKSTTWTGKDLIDLESKNPFR